MSRISVDDMMMQVAHTISNRATCPRGCVGAVIVSPSRRILSTGYNGVPKNFPHCTETGCLRGEDGKHLYLLHAEENAVINAAYEGVSLAGAIAYVTKAPCSHCAAVLIQAGISKIIYSDNDNISQDTYKLLNTCNVEIVKINGGQNA